MRKFTVNNRGLAESDDGVVIHPVCSHERASYSTQGIKYIIPWETLTDANGSFDRYFLKSAYIDGKGGIPLSAEILDTIAADLGSALSALGLRYELRR